MDTAKLKRFAQFARRSLIEQVTAKLKQVLATESTARREHPEAVAELEKQIKTSSQTQVIERVAYTWFNRFCALRFMDVNRYTRISVVSPAEGQFQPEILAEAKLGHLDEELIPAPRRQQIQALLNERAPSRDPQAEAYRLLVVALCNYYHQVMPYLFERIADYTELLIPDDLLSGNSILAYTREALPPDACADVEVIGWLYQFYIAEKKDEVFEGLRKNRKIAPQDIPAATQLFTPHWIVRYLVENSLGRLWLLNHPNSRLRERMAYYIEPDPGARHSPEPAQYDQQRLASAWHPSAQETDFLRIRKPEELKVCDPACGSGHMLTYAFDLLYAIYAEEGYPPAEIPEKILTHNLYGIEIDERAGALAAFALTMKARAQDRRFFRRPVQPHICVLKNIEFRTDELKAYMDFVGRDLFTETLQTTLGQFEEADNFGALIRPALTDGASMRAMLAAKNAGGHLFLSQTHEKVLQVLKYVDFLSPQYQVVITNPPYMGGGGMNARLSEWAKQNYRNSKSDLFSMFMERSLELTLQSGFMGMINLPSWLFLSTFEPVRKHILSNYSIESLLHMGRGIFGIDWGSTAFTIKKSAQGEKVGHFFRLHKRNFQHIHYNDIKTLFINALNNHGYKYDFDEYRDYEGAINVIKTVSNEKGQQIYYRASAADFKKIPGSPIAYWVSEHLRHVFSHFPALEKFAETRIGLITGENERYIRQWHEVSVQRIGFGLTREEASTSGKKWFPQSKGGDFRKWFGNNETILDWSNDGHELQTRLHVSGTRTLAHNFNLDKIFLAGITWTKISSGMFSARYQPKGFLFNDASANAFVNNESQLPALLGFLASKLPVTMLQAVNPTLNFLPGNIASLPVAYEAISKTANFKTIALAIKLSEKDWDSYEISWDFSNLPLLSVEHRCATLATTYTALRTHWQAMTLDMQRLEEENNRIFIEAYGLQGELTPDVPLAEITLTCNPYYRYDAKKPEAELEALLLADTMREFISYAVGCMFGRYSLDKPGLILANQGETLEDYLRIIGDERARHDDDERARHRSPGSGAYADRSDRCRARGTSPDPTFPPDADNVIPLLEEDWFTDDITERFRAFLRVTFGETHYQENLAFIEKAIGKELRKYFVKDFYNDHLKRYKKRPIYWLFSSPKGSFNALIYLHRYRPDTVSIVLNDYLREFRTKLSAQQQHLAQVSISAAATAGEKTKALREIEKLRKMIEELDEYEREILYPLATQQLAIDLDDGVKVNYLKFGAALKKIPGLDASEE